MGRHFIGHTVPHFPPLLYSTVNKLESTCRHLSQHPHHHCRALSIQQALKPETFFIIHPSKRTEKQSSRDSVASNHRITDSDLPTNNKNRFSASRLISFCQPWEVLDLSTRKTSTKHWRIKQTSAVVVSQMWRNNNKLNYNVDRNFPLFIEISIKQNSCSLRSASFARPLIFRRPREMRVKVPQDWLPKTQTPPHFLLSDQPSNVNVRAT